MLATFSMFFVAGFSSKCCINVFWLALGRSSEIQAHSWRKKHASQNEMTCRQTAAPATENGTGVV